MISLVVVSHSRALAAAAVELAREMVDAPTCPRLEVAAGLDAETLGTDATAVAEAMTRAYEASGGDGVLVLVDLGSAVLSAEMALDLVPTAVAARTRLSPAPLVEGLVSAVVAASAGLDLDTCAREAFLAQRGKAEHLGVGTDHVDAGARQPAGAEPSTSAEAGLRAELAVLAEHGLHARPAARLVSSVSEVAPDTTVQLRNLTSGRGPVDALSLSAVATLDAQQGHVLLAEARGPRAEEALSSLASLAAQGFGDLPGPAEPLSETGDRLRAASADEPRGVASGLEAAVGPVVLLAQLPDPSQVETADPATEAARLREAIVSALHRLQELADHARRHVGEEEADVFLAHATLLRDPDLMAAAQSRIDAGVSAAAAWSGVVEEAAVRFDGLADPYQRERALDVRSLGDRILRLLLGLAEPDVVDDGILVVDELDPALALALDQTRVRGILTRAGAATGHGVLIATARGIPVLTGVGGLVDVPDGTLVGFDARSGLLAVEPDVHGLAAVEEIVEARRREREAALHNTHLPAVTTDQVPIKVMSIVSSLADARLGAGLGADGSGLVRTEAVFARWRQAPSVDMQVEVYQRLADVFHPHPVTIRTWDVGGDKPLPFVTSPPETNPFLGARGLRAFATDPTVLLDQLEAVCRAAVDRHLRVVFPMVTTLRDVRHAQALLHEAAQRAGLATPGLEVGIMIEVPAAALRVHQLAQDLDFVSIGTNDLIQFVLAAERGNPGVTAWSDRLEPAVLQLIAHVAEHVPEGVSVGLCGAMAAEPDLVGLLAGLGVEEISSTAASVPIVKQRLRSGSMAQFRALAERALEAPDAAAVQGLVDASLPGRRPRHRRSPQD